MGTVTSNLALYSALAGAFLPVAISAIQQWHWPTHVRSLVAFAACVVAALGTSWLEGNLTAKGITAAVLITLTTARSSYAALWKPTGVLDQVEAKTSGTTVEQVRRAQMQGLADSLAPAIVGQAAESASAGREVKVVLRSTLDAKPLEEPPPSYAAIEIAPGEYRVPEGAYGVLGPEPETIPADQDPLVAVSTGV